MSAYASTVAVRQNGRTMPRRKPIMMSMEPIDIRRDLSEPTILLAANWVKDTTLLYGGSISTAFTVAGIFAQGLEQELKRRAEAGET